MSLCQLWFFLSDSFLVSLSKAFNEVFFAKKKKKGESRVVGGGEEEEQTKLWLTASKKF